MHHIGGILGWLAAFFEQEEGQLARIIDIHAPNTESDEQDIESA
jgi:hypothetical protein